MALGAIQVQEFHGDRLSLEAKAKLVVDESFVNRSEPAFSDEIPGGETLGHDLDLSQSEHVNIRASERHGEVLGEDGIGIAQIDLRNSFERTLLRRHLLRGLRRQLAAADRRQKRPP